MIIIKNLTFFFLSIIFLTGCNKDKVDQAGTDKQNEKKEALTDQKSNQQKSVSEKESQAATYFTVDKVEKQNGKKAAPNIIWRENGTEKSLKDLKGNVILVNLWATWCGPCIKEMPALSAISEELKDKKFKMIGLNIFQQERSKKIGDFLATNPVSYTILDGNQDVVDAFGQAIGSDIQAVPTTFIIDKDGNIAETIIGGRDKESFLKSINKYIN